MKAKKIIYIIFILTFFVIFDGYGQDKKTFEGFRWRAGLSFQYSSSFKNITIPFSSGYTGVLGGFTGKGVNIFGGYKLHKYLAIELEAGVLINSFNRSYGYGDLSIGRFNKFYLHPKIKFIYPVLKRDYGTVNVFVGGGIGFNASGRLYIEERYDVYRDIIYAKYDPMIAPFAVFGTELLLGNRSNIVIGLKYQDGSFNAKEYNVSYDPYANIKNAPAEIKTLNAKGIGLSIGIIQEF